MSSASRAWIVATSIGAIEASKDQGFCRWNYAIRLLRQHAKNNLGSISQANNLSSYMATSKVREPGQSEEFFRKVMYLSCWGPN
uniref:Wound-responsive family protein n=1 Tax=Rhizophora mucronata TaxID=61149 RepID=A0A2P2KYU3_RHIMU